jgi:hypothetical protein
VSIERNGMKDPAVEEMKNRAEKAKKFAKEKLPFYKISLAFDKDKRFVEGSFVERNLDGLTDMFSELSGTEEVRITRVYMTEKEFCELPEFGGF